MSHRFRFLGLPDADDTWVISGDELHHLSKVLRLSEGDHLEVTDGRGKWIVGELVELSAKAARISVLEQHREASPVARRMVAVGALKPGSIDEILPAMVELGVDEIHIFQQPHMSKSRLADNAQRRWRKILSGAVKQSKRSWMVDLHIHASVEDLIGHVREVPLRWVLDPKGSRSLFQAVQVAAGDRMAVIGGEAGFHHHEMDKLLAAGFEPVRCGDYILRAVTASVAAAAVMVTGIS